jgi:hypothetical protein
LPDNQGVGKPAEKVQAPGSLLASRVSARTSPLFDTFAALKNLRHEIRY